MAASDRSLRVRRPSTLRLVGKQVGYQLKLLARSPMAAFATLVIPLMVLLAVNLLYSGTRLSSRGGISFARFFTPAMVAFALVNACYMSVISSTALAREQGILKRIRGTPLPSWVYMTGRIVSSGLVAAVGAVVVIAVGAAVYGFHIIWAGVPAALLTLAVAMFCFCSLGLAVSVLVPSADSAVPIAWGAMLPLCFISDVFQRSTTRRTGCARSRRASRCGRSPTISNRCSTRSPGLGDPPSTPGADGPLGPGGSRVRAVRVPLRRQRSPGSWRIAALGGVRGGPRARTARGARPTRVPAAGERTVLAGAAA